MRQVTDASTVTIVDGIKWTCDSSSVSHSPLISPLAPGYASAPSPYNTYPMKYSAAFLSNELNRDNVFVLRINEGTYHAVTLKGYENWGPNYNVVYNDPWTGDEEVAAWIEFNPKYRDTVESFKTTTPYF